MKVVRFWIMGLVAYDEQVPQILSLLPEPLHAYMGESLEGLYELGLKFTSRRNLHNNLVIVNAG